MERELNIYQRMLAIMADVGYVQKENKTINNQYRFVSHDAVTAKIRVALIRHGVLAVPSIIKRERDGNITEIDIVVKYINVDNPVEIVEAVSSGSGIDKQDKGIGKAMSYAVKYNLLKTFCLETGDDPERDSIDRDKKKNDVTPEEKDFLKKIKSSKMLTDLEEIGKEIKVFEFSPQAQMKLREAFVMRKRQITSVTDETPMPDNYENREQTGGK